MPQLHLYLPEETAKALRQRAKAKGLTLSKYLAESVRREVGGGWPKGFFTEVAGAWRGEGIKRPKQLPLEERESLE